MRIVLTCLIACVACESVTVQTSPRGFRDGVRLESEHFTYYSRAADDDVCADTIAGVEDHFAAVTPALGLSWKPGRKIEYFKFLDQADLDRASLCSSGFEACAIGLSVMSPWVIHGHELIHAYGITVGSPAALFTEGLAEVLSCQYRRWTPEDRARLEVLRWEWLAIWHRASSWEYAAAAQLTRFLIDRFGIESVMGFYAVAPSSRIREVVAASFLEHFGLALPDAWQEALKVDHPDGICLTPHQCGSPPVALDGTPAFFAERCGMDEEFRTFTLAEGSAVSVTPGGDGDFQIRSCDGLQAAPSWNAFGSIPGWNDALLTRLPAGRYFVHHRRDERLNGLGSAAVRARPGGWISTDCSAAVADPFSVDVSTRGLTIEVPGGAPITYAAISFAQPTTVEVSDPSGVPGPAFLCDRCGQDTNDCPIRGDGGVTTATLQGTYVIVVPTDPVPGTVSRGLRLRAVSRAPHEDAGFGGTVPTVCPDGKTRVSNGASC